MSPLAVSLAGQQSLGVGAVLVGEQATCEDKARLSEPISLRSPQCLAFGIFGVPDRADRPVTSLPSRGPALAPDRGAARPVITNRNPDDALTDTVHPFLACARAEESSHPVRQRAHGAAGVLLLLGGSEEP